MDKKERIVLAERVQRRIQIRPPDFKFIAKRNEIEKEFKKWEKINGDKSNGTCNVSRRVLSKMKKVALFTFLMIFYAQHLAFSQQKLDAMLLLERFKKVSSQVMDARIKLGEALIKHLEHQGDYAQIERIKNIYRLATEYQNFCEGEQRALFMYIYIKDAVKVYISAYLRDLLQKKKKELDASLKNILNYSDDLKDKNDLLIVTKLQSSIVEAQEVTNQLVDFYSSENIKYKKKKNNFE